MSTRLQSRRPSKRRAVEGTWSQGKVVLDVDLNAYPDEIPASSRISLEASDNVVSLPCQAVATPRGDVRQEAALIDVDAIDDDVVLVSSSRSLSQVQNPSRRTTLPVVVVLDDDLAAHRISSGSAVEDPLTILSGCSNRLERSPSTRNIINCEAYENLNCNCNSEIMVVVSCPEPQEVIPKEPMYRCAVCLGRLVDETSTSCGHVFCQDCIKTAIKTQKKCPTCRTSLTMKKIHRIYLPSV